jgi:uncharacterized protein YceH (UPF0502 family)
LTGPAPDPDQEKIVVAELDPTERRIVGALIEKALSTPQYYPMTLNALVAACNQKNNRDPVTSYTDFEVEGALRSLFEKKWVTYVDGGGRVRKWRHRADEHLGASPPEIAVLAELLLRGPQQPNELQRRCERMVNIPTPEALMQALEDLARRTPPVVVNLGRRSGERADRWGQMLAPDPGAPVAAEPASPVGATPATGSPPPAAAIEAAAPPSPSLPFGDAPAEAPPSQAARPSSAAESLADRVARLEAEVAELRRRIEATDRQP